MTQMRWKVEVPSKPRSGESKQASWFMVGGWRPDFSFICDHLIISFFSPPLNPTMLPQSRPRIRQRKAEERGRPFPMTHYAFGLMSLHIVVADAFIQPIAPSIPAVPTAAATGPTCTATATARIATTLRATSDIKSKARRGRTKAKRKSKGASSNSSLEPAACASSAAVLVRTLQAECHTPSLILSKVGTQLSPSTDDDGRVSSLVLVRMAKLAVEQMNAALFASESAGVASFDLWDHEDDQTALDMLSTVCSTLATAVESNSADLENSVEGIKAAGVLSRILVKSGVECGVISSSFGPLVQSFKELPFDEDKKMEEHYLSGLRWSFDNLSYSFGMANEEGDIMPTHLNKAYQDIGIPFRIKPGLLDSVADLNVANLSNQVQFKAETIKTTNTSKSVKERRLTAWEGESGDIPGFAYSSKVMKTRPFSPLVRSVRDELRAKTGEDYDCCLLNLYPDGESGMRYHIDPDQGELWGYETAVVSVGAARRFAFRPIAGIEGVKNGNVHNFVVMDGDVTEMFGLCQQKYQHTVKTAEGRGEAASRSSLVYKKTLRSVW